MQDVTKKESLWVKIKVKQLENRREFTVVILPLQIRIQDDECISFDACKCVTFDYCKDNCLTLGCWGGGGYGCFRGDPTVVNPCSSYNGVGPPYVKAPG